MSGMPAESGEQDPPWAGGALHVHRGTLHSRGWNDVLICLAGIGATNGLAVTTQRIEAPLASLAPTREANDVGRELIPDPEEYEHEQTYCQPCYS